MRTADIRVRPLLHPSRRARFKVLIRRSTQNTGFLRFMAEQVESMKQRNAAEPKNPVPVTSVGGTPIVGPTDPFPPIRPIYDSNGRTGR